MGFFIDDLLTNPELTYRLYATTSGSQAVTNRKDITENNNTGVYLGSAPINKDSISYSWNNSFSQLSSGQLAATLNTVKNYVLKGNKLVSNVFTDLNNAFEFSDALAQYTDSGLEKFTEGLQNLASKVSSLNIISPGQYTKQFAGSEVDSGVNSISIYYIHGAKMADGKECNVKERLAKLLKYTLGDTWLDESNSNSVTLGNILGLESSPNNYTFSNALGQYDMPGTFKLAYGSGESLRIITDLLVSGVNVVISPFTSDGGDDYYYAIVNISFDTCRKYVKNDLAYWMGLDYEDVASGVSDDTIKDIKNGYDTTFNDLRQSLQGST